MTSKVTPEETQQVNDVKTDQPGAPKNNAVVLSTAQPKKIQMPTRYANSILNKDIVYIIIHVFN